MTKRLYFVVYDNGYGCTQMAVVSAANREKAKEAARDSWNEIKGTTHAWPDRDLIAQPLSQLKDGWVW